MPDIPAEVRVGSAFETIDRAVLRETLPGFYRATMQYHGAAGRDWQQWLVGHSAELRERIERERQEFLALPQVQDVESRAQPHLRSIVRRFGLYAASLRLAIDANVLPWAVAEADAGLIAVLERWVNRRGNLDEGSALVRVADEVVARINAALSDRFIAIHKPKRAWEPVTEADRIKQESATNFDGYAKPEHILVRPEAFHRYCGQSDPGQIAKRLQQQGALIADDSGGKFSKLERVMGKKPDRYYVLKRSV
jgi:hypothetical protein